MRCAASKMTTARSGRTEAENRKWRNEDAEEDSGMVSDDVSGHIAPSSSSSRSSLFSSDSKPLETRAKSDERLNRPNKSMHSAKKASDQSSTSRGKKLSAERCGVFGHYDNGKCVDNQKPTKKWKSSPVNVIVQHNPDGTVTAKAVTPTERSERDFASCAPKSSFSLNDISLFTAENNTPRRMKNSDTMEDVVDDFDDVDGVSQVQRMIRDTSLELFSLPECKAETVADFKSSKTGKRKDFKPLMVFPGGENIAEKESDAVATDSTKHNVGHDSEDARNTSAPQDMSPSEVASLNYSEENRHDQPVGIEVVGIGIRHANVPGISEASAGDVPAQNQEENDPNELELPSDALKNADMSESLTGPTTSKVVEELQSFQSHHFHQLIPELGFSEGSLAAGDSVLLAASGILDDVGKSDMTGSTEEMPPHQWGFRIPRDSIRGAKAEADFELNQQGTVIWESNLRVSGFGSVVFLTMWDVIGSSLANGEMKSQFRWCFGPFSVLIINTAGGHQWIDKRKPQRPMSLQ